VLEETKHLYYNAIIIFQVGYQVSNFLINQPSCALISDPSPGHPESALVPRLIFLQIPRHIFSSYQMYEATAKRIEQSHIMNTVKTPVVCYLRVYCLEVFKRVRAFLCGIRSAIRTLLNIINRHTQFY